MFIMFIPQTCGKKQVLIPQSQIWIGLFRLSRHCEGCGTANLKHLLLWRCPWKIGKSIGKKMERKKKRVFSYFWPMFFGSWIFRKLGIKWNQYVDNGGVSPHSVRIVMALFQCALYERYCCVSMGTSGVGSGRSWDVSAQNELCFFGPAPWRCRNHPKMVSLWSLNFCNWIMWFGDVRCYVANQNIVLVISVCCVKKLPLAASSPSSMNPLNFDLRLTSTTVASARFSENAHRDLPKLAKWCDFRVKNCTTYPCKQFQNSCGNEEIVHFFVAKQQ